MTHSSGTNIPHHADDRNGQSRKQAEDKQNQTIREAIRTILDGQPPPDGPDYGDFTPVVTRLKTALATNGQDTARRMYEVFRHNDRRLAALMDTPPTPRPSVCPPLPTEVDFPPEVGASACKWLDAYIAFSKKWAPEAYEGFHEAVGVWVLSALAQRRVVIPLGRPQYTSLYIALVARTSLFTKSTAADIGVDVIKSAGLEDLFLPDECSPQKLISTMAGNRVPEEYGALGERDQQRILKRLALAGQRGWFYEEFGQKIQGMMRDDGPMAPFRNILKRMDDGKDSFEYDTIGRGNDRIEHPYLALLAVMTPADMRPLAKRGAAMWNDGYWARFAFITPPKGQRKSARFPDEQYAIPHHLMAPLKHWHEQLGTPMVAIAPVKDKKGKETGHYTIERGQLPKHTCTFGEGVVDAFYRYRNALLEMTARSDQEDLDGNYARFSAKAFRVAALFASLENAGHIEIRHWARAQDITERWRIGLHELFEQLNDPQPSPTELTEDKILHFVAKQGSVTAREVRQYVRGLDSSQAKTYLDSLVRSGMLQEVDKPGAKTHRYTLPREEAD